MKWFFNLKMSVKIISAFLIIAVILAFIGFYGLNNMNTFNRELNSMYDDRLIPIKDLSAVQNLYQRIRVNIRDMNAIARTEAENEEYKEKILALANEIEGIIETYSRTELTQEEQKILQEVYPAWETYQRLLDEAIRMNSRNVSSEEFTRFLLEGGYKEAGDHLQNILDRLIAINVAVAEKQDAESDIRFANSRMTTIIVIIASLIISVGFGYWISQMIARPLNRIVELVGRVAEGDLRETTDFDTKDEIGRLAGSINQMVVGLRATVGGILASAESVSAAAQQISASTEEIAGGSTSQAHSAQTINERFKELSSAIHLVARSAEQASELSDNTLSIAQDGGKVVHTSIDGMNRVNQQMTRLEEDSNRIGAIIEVIDDIAEQTNLLALNAAIEAARAGDQGRGFAVVADEVRKLAERSGEATKQITAIIKGMQENTLQSVKAVGEGVVSSQKTGEAFESIMAMVTETAHKVSEIAAASEEQSAQSSEVLVSIESISAATEEAAASSEETASTAQSLAELAEQLNHSVSTFKLN